MNQNQDQNDIEQPAIFWRARLAVAEARLKSDEKHMTEQVLQIWKLNAELAAARAEIARLKAGKTEAAAE